MSALDADALANLTPEEREAIQGSEHSEADLEALKKVAGDDASDITSNDDEGDDDDDDADDDAPAESSQPEPKPEPKPEPEEEPNSAKADNAPRYDAKLPSDYDDQIKSLKHRDAELRQRFKDGDIDIDERDAGLAELTEQREQLLVLRAKAEISQEMTQQSAAQTWQATVNKALTGFAQPENGGIDYRKDTAKAEDLDTFVKMLANKQENSDKPMEWFLQEAHKRVQALYGVAQAPRRETVADAMAKRKPPIDAAPKTLAQVPGSDGPGDVGGEFADIEALEGMEYEDAIARMSPAQREKFLRGR